MEGNCTKLTERILQLTLEIIYLLTGEDNIVVKKTSRDGQNTTMVPLQFLEIPERNNEQKILEVTQKIIELMTGETENWSHLKDVAKKETTEEEEEDSEMKGQACLEGHKELYKEVMMASQPALTPPDGSSNGNPSERCPRPLYSQASTQEDLTIPHHHQGVDILDIKTEIKEEEETYVRGNQPSVEEAEMKATQEKSSLVDRTGGHTSWNTAEEQDNSEEQYSASFTEKIHHKCNDVVRSTEGFHLEESKDELHTIIPNVQARFPNEDKPPDPSNPQESPANNSYNFQDCENQFIKHHDQRIQTGEHFPCSESGKSFTKKSNLNEHLGIHSKEKPFSCSDCGKSFVKKLLFIQHQRVHTGEKPFLCSECGKNFINKSDLSKHRRYHTKEKPFSCSECEKSFVNKSDLLRHHRIHTGEKPFLCSECGKSFMTKSDLDKHKKIHTKVKPFSCSECEKSFIHRSDLLRHHRIHTGEKPFSCPECGKSFAQKSFLNTHQSLHTGEKPFSCSDCGKSFRQKSRLCEHLKLHTGEKPFSCIECGKSFIQKAVLNAHYRVHNGEKPFSCSKCGKSFSNKRNCDRHMKIHNGGKQFSCPK